MLRYEVRSLQTFGHLGARCRKTKYYLKSTGQDFVAVGMSFDVGGR